MRSYARRTGAVVVLALTLTTSGARAAAPVRLRDTSARRAPVNAPHLLYWGGRLLAHVKVVVVVWGSGHYLTQVTRTSAPNVPSFFANGTNSRYLDWLREYDAGGAHIARGSLVGRFVITPSIQNDGASVDDVANIRPELIAQIRAGHLPPLDDNTLYVLFFRSGQVVTQGGLDSVSGFCAYHNTTRIRTRRVRYAVVPANAAGPHCGPGPGFANLTTAASHELVEAVTDPDVGLATHLAAPLSWYDPANGEIGDICAGLTATVVGADARSYTVQKEWSNRRRACVAA